MYNNVWETDSCLLHRTVLCDRCEVKPRSARTGPRVKQVHGWSEGVWRTEDPQWGPEAEPVEGLGTKSPRSWNTLPFPVTNINGIFEQVLRILNSILHLHISNQEASTGWARPEINDTKTPNWLIICLLYNRFEFAKIFILKLKIYTVFLRIYLSIYQLHILLSRTAHIASGLHFCVELQTKSPALVGLFSQLTAAVGRHKANDGICNASVV